MTQILKSFPTSPHEECQEQVANQVTKLCKHEMNESYPKSGATDTPLFRICMKTHYDTIYNQCYKDMVNFYNQLGKVGALHPYKP